MVRSRRGLEMCRRDTTLNPWTHHVTEWPELDDGEGGSRSVHNHRGLFITGEPLLRGLRPSSSSSSTSLHSNSRMWSDKDSTRHRIPNQFRALRAQVQLRTQLRCVTALDISQRRGWSATRLVVMVRSLSLSASGTKFVGWKQVFLSLHWPLHMCIDPAHCFVQTE